MADYHVRRTRMPSNSSDDFEDESLDPRIQVELEKLNKASEEINRLELELDDARASFRQTLSESTQKLDILAKKLGSCVEKARPYYDARVKAKEAHLETQRAALRFERACSMHEAAKEMVQLAEQGYMRREQPSDPAWQEMLNHATMKVNEAEKERIESEQEHERTMIRFKQSEDQVQALQKDLKRAITKSKTYFEMKARFNQIMEEHKQRVGSLEREVGQAKAQYSGALRSLEAISDDIHQTRLQRRRHNQQLGVRGAGVGAECPLPPPPPHSWENGQKSLDPLGVMKVAAFASCGSGSANLLSQHRRSRNLSGESSHGKEEGEREGGVGVVGGEAPVPTPLSSSLQLEEKTKMSEEGGEAGKEAEVCGPSPVIQSPVSSPVLIPGDPLGVIPPVYHTKPKSTSPSSSSSNTITHPAFAKNTITTHPSPASLSSQIIPCHVTSTTPTTTGDVAAKGSNSKESPAVTAPFSSTSSAVQTFATSSLVFANPEQARRESYRRAIESSQRPQAEEEEEEEGVAGGAGEEEGVFWESRQRSYSSPAQPGSDSQSQAPPHSPPKAIPPPHHPSHSRISLGQESALADGRRHSSAPEQWGLSGERGSEASSPAFSAASSSSCQARRNKLQGLILRVDASMDPLCHLQQGKLPHRPPTKSPSAHRQSLLTQTSTAATARTTAPLQGEAARTPTTTFPRPPPHTSTSDYTIGTNTAAVTPTPTASTHPIIRSASTVSNAGSEASEFSEVESVSATQSPTRPHPPHPQRVRLLNVPSSLDTMEDSSDTESLASTGPMLDDEQVEFLTMDFSDINLERFDDDHNNDNHTLLSAANLKRNSWNRMSLPPRLSYLENFLARQTKKMAGEFEDIDDDVTLSQCEGFDEDQANAMMKMRMTMKDGKQVSGDDIEHCDGEVEEEEEKEENCVEGAITSSDAGGGKESGVVVKDASSVGE